jgi:hypothetical protein
MTPEQTPHVEFNRTPTSLETLDYLTTINWSLAQENQDLLRTAALDLLDKSTLDEALADIGPRTSIIFVAAGAGTRWDQSFEDKNIIYGHAEYDIARGRSRAMARVPNVLPREIFPEDTIPAIGYNLWASGGIPGAKRYVISKEEDQNEIEELAKKLGINVECRLQAPVRGKVRGHGDALEQNLDSIIESDYTLVQFCGDASSPRTIHDTLLAIDALSKSASTTKVLMATTPEKAESQPLAIDSAGLVRRWNQFKLFEQDIVRYSSELEPSGVNVSIYAFDSRRLAEDVATISSYHSRLNTYSFLPFHPETSDEFAIDDAILMAAQRGEVRQLCIASAEEATTTKDLSGLPRLVKAMEGILRQNGYEIGYY